MYSETNQRNRSSKGDFWTVILLILVVLIVEGIAVSLSKSIPVFGMIIQGLIFIAIVVFCLFIYKKLLTSYRYTLLEQPLEDNPDIKVGAFAIESCVGDKCTPIFTAQSGDIVDISDEQNSDAEFINATVFGEKNCKYLTCKIDEKLYSIRVCISETMLEKLIKYNS